MNTLRAPELLLPAGTLDKMRSAFAFGADAVYAGQPRYSLRARNNEFQLEQLEIGINEAHQLGKKFFVASNLMPHNAKVKTYMADMEPVIAMQPDALIMADAGLIAMVRERWPEVPIHLSVQANTVNYAAVKFWQSLGLTRVILSRELSLDEIKEYTPRVPGYGTGSVRCTARCASPIPTLSAVRLLQPPRCEPGHLHQLLPLGLQGGQRDRRRHRQYTEN